MTTGNVNLNNKQSPIRPIEVPSPTFSKQENADTENLAHDKDGD